MTTPEAALRVAMVSAGISLGSLLGNFILFWLSGARLKVQFIPAVFTHQGSLAQGPERGWENRVDDSIGSIIQSEYYVDLAIIKVTNIGRTPVSVSRISLDFGRSGLLRYGRRTVAGKPVPVHDCHDVTEDVRLEPGEGVSVAMESQSIIDHEVARGDGRLRSVRGSATAAGRRPTLSSWSRRWRIWNSRTGKMSEKLYYPAGRTPEREAFVEVFRAVYPLNPSEVYPVWVAVSTLLLSDASAGPKEVAGEMASFFEGDEWMESKFIFYAIKIVRKFPEEFVLGGVSYRRGEWG